MITNPTQAPFFFFSPTPPNRRAEPVGQVLSPMSAAPAAFAEGCQSTCEAECLKVAPGSADYCASACTDECSALKADNGGEEIESTTSVRNTSFYT